MRKKILNFLIHIDIVKTMTINRYSILFKSLFLIIIFIFPYIKVSAEVLLHVIASKTDGTPITMIPVSEATSTNVSLLSIKMNNNLHWGTITGQLALENFMTNSITANWDKGTGDGFSLGGRNGENAGSVTDSCAFMGGFNSSSGTYLILGSNQRIHVTTGGLYPQTVNPFGTSAWSSQKLYRTITEANFGVSGDIHVLTDAKSDSTVVIGQWQLIPENESYALFIGIISLSLIEYKRFKRRY